jgi:hypothetical protein
MWFLYKLSNFFCFVIIWNILVFGNGLYTCGLTIRLVFTDDAGKTDEDTGRFLVDLVVVVHLDKLLSE